MKTKILIPLLTLASIVSATDFNVHGEVKLYGDGYYKQQDPRFGIDNTNDPDLIHTYTSTFKLAFQTIFNEHWNAIAKINADAEGSSPRFLYDGAYLQYTKNKMLNYRIGDLTYSEGKFKYYDYDDTGKFAAGLRDRNIRGAEINFWDMSLGAGFKRGLVAFEDNGFEVIEEDSRSYIIHFAANIPFSTHLFRSYINYESNQASESNSLRSGMVLHLNFAPYFNLQAVHASYTDKLREKYPRFSQAITVEPELNLGMMNLKGTFYYAFLHDNLEKATPIEVPEYMFAYLEPGFSFSKKFSLGLPVEYHTMSLDDDDNLEQIFVGPRFYLTPAERLSIKSFVRMGFPIGDDYQENEMHIGTEVEVAFHF
ncbi:MAG: hypothetical protein IIU83_02910 [Fibrobacteraceae bacterium]|jgi:hypothetical protein|nr:hypothetical protein [Fibrobacteraceae bacterium]